MIGYIYTLTKSGSPNDIFYVGSTTNIKARWIQHKTRHGYDTMMNILQAIEIVKRSDLLPMEKVIIGQCIERGHKLKNKMSPQNDLSAPLDIIKYVTEIKTRKYGRENLTKSLFNAIVWEALREHKFIFRDI